jgi:hypothetical protein
MRIPIEELNVKGKDDKRNYIWISYNMSIKLKIFHKCKTIDVEADGVRV